MGMESALLIAAHEDWHGALQRRLERLASLSPNIRRHGMKDISAASRRWLQWVAPQLMLAPVLLLLALPAQAQPVAFASIHPATQPRTVLVLGDSLSAGYGLDSSQGWVTLTADRVVATKPGWRVINASISGETSDGGAARVVHEVSSILPSVVVIELGANDGLRGLPLRQTRRNLAYMIGAAQGVHAKVLLIGMRLPPNYGAQYTHEFEGNYRALAALFHTAFVPFLLAPIMRDATAFQPDNMHPVARVQPLIRDHVWTVLAPLLD
jgi:acyl-CoA thioesterase-1